MRLSEFTRAIAEEFGQPYGDAVVRDLVITELDDRTARQALDAGVEPRTVWLAVCTAMEVPESRRHGVGRIERRDRR